MKTVTLKEIASELGVSATAVSVALSGDAKRRRISDDLAARIRRKAHDMGYFPDLGARRLRDRGNRHLMVAILTSYEAPLSLIGTLLREAENHMKSHCPENMKISLTVEYYHAGRLSEMGCFESKANFHAAIISNTLPNDDAFLARNKFAFPVVLIGRDIPGYSSIMTEPNSGGDKAANVLIDRDCENLAVLRPSFLTQSTNARVESFVRTSRDLLGREPEQIVVDKITEEAGYNGVVDYLKSGKSMDGLFIISDTYALGVYAAFKKNGLRIPRDVKVVGFDMLPFNAFLDPPLTSIVVPNQTIQKEVSHLILRMLMGEISAPVQQIFQNEIFLRESTGN